MRIASVAAVVVSVIFMGACNSTSLSPLAPGEISGWLDHAVWNGEFDIVDANASGPQMIIHSRTGNQMHTIRVNLPELHGFSRIAPGTYIIREAELIGPQDMLFPGSGTLVLSSEAGDPKGLLT
jgi:hypothetical protein